jgi:arylsulfatase A
MVDSMGYGDSDPYGAPDIRTPSLNRLAREGMRLTDGYANGPVCTPTRAAFLTGRYQQRVGLEWFLLKDRKDAGLPSSEVSIAKLLKQRGYATGLFGKWHLGYKPEFGPNAHGFDEFFGILDWSVDY